MWSTIWAKQFCYHGKHTGFQTFPFLKVFLATWCLIYMIQQAHKYVSLSLFNALRAENHLHIEVICEGKGKEWVAMGTKCSIAVGVFSVELLACQVSMVCTANWPRYILDVILGWVYDIISHLICIFCTLFKLKYLRNLCRYLQTVNGIFILSQNSMWYT